MLERVELSAPGIDQQDGVALMKRGELKRTIRSMLNICLLIKPSWIKLFQYSKLERFVDYFMMKQFIIWMI